MTIPSTKQLIAVTALVAAVLPAKAVDFNFYRLGRGVANGDFLPELPYTVLLGDNISSTLGGVLTFKNGGLTVNSLGTYNGGAAYVVQDHESSWDAARGDGAGLGVYHVLNNTSDDNITAGEVLTITFNQPVNLTGIGLANDGHVINWTGSGIKTFNFGIDGGALSSTLFPDDVNGGVLSGNWTGTTFTFAYGGADADQFYLSSLTATAVPDGGATVALLGVGILGVGAMRRFLV